MSINYKIIYLLTVFILIFFFTNHLIKGGTIDVEAYYTGIYSITFLYKNLYNFFLTFYDGIGPGMELPLGQGPFLFPTSILLFFFNFKIFLIVTCIFCLIIQIIFFCENNENFKKNKILIFLSIYYHLFFA